VICGHTHVAEVSNEYINLGSFCEETCSYLTIDKKGNIKLDFC
jgi:UDP-2,3-diacylglucosamine pyrophosphatase LpxH